MLVHLAVLGFTTGFQLAYARHNTTVSNNDAAITYSGNWIKTSDNLTTEASYMLTRDPSAKAFFNFTGTAIYFMSPLWPYLSSTAISLDSSSPVVIDLVDHNHPGVGYGFATVNSTTMWGISGLPNTGHTLVISVGERQPLAVVDSLIYTELEATPEHLLFIIVGAALGSLGFLVFLMVPWLFLRQRRRAKVKAKHMDYARHSLEMAGYQISTPVHRIAQHMIPRIPVSNIHGNAHSKQDSKERPLSSDSIPKSLPPGA
ncbi:hypothetical protein BDQ12DRAFT_727895 [Crucibulum laeve]|uniref:Uncharacterized protein n=1 Tax=Crucibulum laeve TaxID=68775 RepID=A0A5C3LK45_9AGAR|nr:hypothetical protein BDQ12DRAFT_727895 [Crucibulum laeve]